jgi:hypothetical protein
MPRRGRTFLHGQDIQFFRRLGATYGTGCAVCDAFGRGCGIGGAPFVGIRCAAKAGRTVIGHVVIPRYQPQPGGE